MTPEAKARQARIHEDARLRTSQLLTEPQVAYAVLNLLISRLPAADFPTLGVIGVYDEDEEETVTRLVCPHCDTQLDSDDDIVAVDLSIRETHSDTIDGEDEHISINYDERTDYEGLVNLCDRCREPVGLPLNWTTD